MVRKGSTVRVRPRALRNSLLTRVLLTDHSAPVAALGCAKVPRRYIADRDGLARLPDHVPRRSNATGSRVGRTRVDADAREVKLGKLPPGR
jgi:hypothetical protein